MIQGERVQLRPMEEGDTDDVVHMRSEPSVLAQLFSDEPPTREGHLRWLAAVRARGDRQEFVIVDRASGRAVGTIGLSRIDPAHRRAEYGVLTGEPDARGKGFAAEASRLLLGYAFGPLGLNRVYLHVFPENEPAIRLYERVGFEREGLLRQHVSKGGRFRDVVVMGVLKGGVA
jgi:UDP-4-amino-4,6-dideoxy-N-acetyl-beta-L-altrosamine N-acetyltransferase